MTLISVIKHDSAEIAPRPLDALAVVVHVLGAAPVLAAKGKEDEKGRDGKEKECMEGWEEKGRRIWSEIRKRE